MLEELRKAIEEAAGVGTGLLRKSQMAFDFSAPATQPHHVAYLRTNARGTTSRIEAKGSPMAKEHHSAGPASSTQGGSAMNGKDVEVTRTNVTVAEFFSAIKAACAKKGMDFGLERDVFENPSHPSNDTYTVKGGIKYARYGKGEPTREFDGTDAPAKSETSRIQPYDYQVHIHNHDGSVYNEICEFTFHDDKRGSGYYYQLNKDADTPPNIREMVTELHDAYERHGRRGRGGLGIDPDHPDYNTPEKYLDSAKKILKYRSWERFSQRGQDEVKGMLNRHISELEAAKEGTAAHEAQESPAQEAKEHDHDEQPVVVQAAKVDAGHRIPPPPEVAALITQVETVATGLLTNHGMEPYRAEVETMLRELKERPSAGHAHAIVRRLQEMGEQVKRGHDFGEMDRVKATDAYGGKKGYVTGMTDSGYVTVEHDDDTSAHYHHSDLRHHADDDDQD